MRRRNKIETQILELSIKKGTEAPGGKCKPKAGTGIEQQIDQAEISSLIWLRS